METKEADLSDIEQTVHDAYSRIAKEPDEIHPFPVGRELAEALGYPGELLDTLPVEAVEAFCGVSNVAVWADVQPGEKVLDLGCGGGLDSLVLSSRGAQVIAVDFSSSMLERARQAVSSAGKASTIQILRSRADSLPLPSGSVDAVVVNGIFNLNPTRAEILKELHRVLRPGGRLYAAEIVRLETTPAVESDADNWVA